MRTITIVRTRNEAKNISRFCQSYQWADKILVADGGSEDNTIEIAKTFPNVEVREFTERKKMEGGLWRNPEAEHINFLIDWAIEEDADWIFFDDCDSVPNWWLRTHLQKLLGGIDLEYNFIYSVRLYLWGKDKHFPQLAKPGGKDKWETSLLGWNVYSGVEFYNTTMGFSFTPQPSYEERYNFIPPYCLLHYSWIDEESVNKKLDFYKRSGQIPDMRHPIEFGGKIEDLPEWATINELE